MLPKRDPSSTTMRYLTLVESRRSYVEDVVASEVRGDLDEPAQRDPVIASEPQERVRGVGGTQLAHAAGECRRGGRLLVRGRDRKLVLSRLLGDDQALEVRPRVVRAQMGGEPLENGAAVRGPRERPADPVLAPVRGEVGGEFRHAGRELVGP